MEFNTLSDMYNYIEQKTNKTIVDKNDLRFKKDMHWIHTEEGKNILNANGYFSRHQIILWIKEIFKMGKGIQVTYSLLINKIKGI